MNLERFTPMNVDEPVSPMQITVRPAEESHDNAVTLDVKGTETVASVISSYCSRRGIPFQGKLALSRDQKQLPNFQTLGSLGISNGAYLEIGYAKRTLGTDWPLFAAVLALLLGVVCLVTVSTLYGTTGGPYDDFGVVMDAGSSKTNTLLYTWQGKKLEGTGQVAQIGFCTVPGGIAKMDPTRLDKVINCAKNITHKITKEALPKTPLYFAATAGMRLLNLTNPNRTNQILVNVEAQLKESGLDIKDVRIISGLDEGTYGWITVNFLKNTLRIPQQLYPWVATTYGALDMGGASMQIAYAVPDTDIHQASTEKLKLYGQTQNVFSHSNLCFGRDESERRYRYLRIVENFQKEIVDDPCSPIGHNFTINATDLFTQPCIYNKELEQYVANNPNIMKMIYTFQGTSSPNECKSNISVLIDTDLCRKMNFKECFKKLDNIPSEQKYLAFATYYYTTDFLNVTRGSLREYDDAATRFCAKSYDDVKKVSSSKYAVQYCFNAKYIHEVLTTGFHFTNSTWSNLEFVDNIGGKDVSWTLGYMINATNLIPAKSDKPKLISTLGFGICLTIFILIILLTVAFIGMYYKQTRYT